MSNDIQSLALVKIGLKQSSLAAVKMFSEWKPKNILTYMKSPERTGDATLQNMSVKAFYIPQVEFTFNVMTPVEYSNIIQILNTRGFVVRYYDTELLTHVVRCMYMSESDIGSLLASAIILQW
jgi:hypothetical protein